MVNQTRQNTTHSCKWGSCTEKFDSVMLLWKHVEQHVDNAKPRLIHLVNDDDDASVTAASVTAPQNTATTKSSINSVATVATSQINQSHNVHLVNTGVVNTTMNGTGHLNNGQNINIMIPNLNLQSMQQTPQPRLLQQSSHMLTSQTSPAITYDLNTSQVIQQSYTSHATQKPRQFALALQGMQGMPTNFFTLPPQFQLGTRPTFLIGSTQIQQQHHQMIQSTGQSTSVQPMIPLGSMPNPITIDDNAMDVDPHVINVNHQRLGRPPATQVKSANLNGNAQSLSQNIKK